jgi:hypothetical protein
METIRRIMTSVSASAEGRNISGVAPRGAVILLSADDADNPSTTGIWRSTNSGQYDSFYVTTP